VNGVSKKLGATTQGARMENIDAATLTRTITAIEGCSQMAVRSACNTLRVEVMKMDTGEKPRYDWRFAGNGVTPALNGLKPGACYIFVFNSEDNRPDARDCGVLNCYVMQESGIFARLQPGSESVKLEDLEIRPVWYKRA